MTSAATLLLCGEPVNQRQARRELNDGEPEDSSGAEVGFWEVEGADPDQEQGVFRRNCCKQACLLKNSRPKSVQKKIASGCPTNDFLRVPRPFLSLKFRRF